MFDIDKWQEIAASMSRNKLRTFLTGFSVAWGIFMLIILLGSGKGLENGVTSMFEGDAINSMWVSGGLTSVAHKGYKTSREVVLRNPDYDYIKCNNPEISFITTRIDVRKTTGITYRNKNYPNFDIKACAPDMQFGENITVLQGRFVNRMDMQQARKVAIIGVPVKEQIFGSKDPLGQFIYVNGVAFCIAGVFKDNGGPWDNKRIYIPAKTAQVVFMGNDKVDELVISTKNADADESKILESQVRNQLALRHEFKSDDERALWINNNLDNYKSIMNVIMAIRIFIWIIGIGTIIAGIMGVSNIMMITVKERTREIGIRKSIGASPMSVIMMILKESILLTSFAGYIGLVLGILVLESAKNYLPENDFFKNPDVDIRLALYALLLIITAGTLAGFFPARRAASIKPIEALKED